MLSPRRLSSLGRALDALPAFTGQPIQLAFAPDLTVHRGRLLANAGIGTAVHAGCDLRRRIIVLDSALRGSELGRILSHELFHFVWMRLGNKARGSWEEVVRGEMARGARGELGWSAECRKTALSGRSDGRRWREYLCESFCDSAAFVYGPGSHSEATLGGRFRDRRAKWFRNQFGGGRIKL